MFQILMAVSKEQFPEQLKKISCNWNNAMTSQVSWGEGPHLWQSSKTSLSVNKHPHYTPASSCICGHNTSDNLGSGFISGKLDTKLGNNLCICILGNKLLLWCDFQTTHHSGHPILFSFFFENLMHESAFVFISTLPFLPFNSSHVPPTLSKTHDLLLSKYYCYTNICIYKYTLLSLFSVAFI